jgi:hypothetical protein
MVARHLSHVRSLQKRIGGETLGQVGVEPSSDCERGLARTASSPNERQQCERMPSRGRIVLR